MAMTPLRASTTDRVARGFGAGRSPGTWAWDPTAVMMRAAASTERMASSSSLQSGRGAIVTSDAVRGRRRRESPAAGSCDVRPGLTSHKHYGDDDEREQQRDESFSVTGEIPI